LDSMSYYGPHHSAVYAQRRLGAQILRDQPCQNADIWSDMLAYSGVCARDVAATTDNVCGLRFAFAISAAKITVFLGEALATGMGTFLLSFHALPSSTLASELSTRRFQ